MKRVIFAAIMAVNLAGCGLSGLASAPAPAAIADRTVLDEQGALAVELAYKAARLGVETAVDAGLIKGDAALRVALLDERAFQAVAAARRIYQTGNAPGYGAALTTARAAIAELLALIQGKLP